MAALCPLITKLRFCSLCSKSYLKQINRSYALQKRVDIDLILKRIQVNKSTNSTGQFQRFCSSSTNEEIDVQEFPSEFESSREEFIKFVKPVLPLEIVPDLPQHKVYPTPSGWFPPNEELRSEQKYQVLRTKNHVLPVYAKTSHREFRTQHYVDISNIQGDIWALESDLRKLLETETKGEELIRTQVHEVARRIRIRGMYAPLVADFLLSRGM